MTLTSGLFERILILRRSPFFHGVSDQELQRYDSDDSLARCGIEPRLRRLSSFFKEEVFRTAGTVILEEGRDSDKFYVIRNGAVSMASNGVHLGVLKSPGYFGEVSLMTSCKQTATVTTVLDNTQCLSLRRDDFDHYIENGDVKIRDALQQALEQRTSVALKSIPFIASSLTTKAKHGGLVTNYDEEKLKLLAQLFRYTEAGAGQDVFQQGQRADTFYIILDGAIEIWSVPAVDGGTPIQLNQLKNGDWFGEDALTGESPLRTVTATSRAHTTLLRLDRQDFEKFAECVPELQNAIHRNLHVRTADWLKKMPFFAKIKENKPWSKLALLGSLFKFKQFADGDVVCREGEFSTGFYIIANGRCRVSVANADDDAELTIDELITGQWFGEMSLLLDSPRTATVTCLTDTLLCILDERSFRVFNDIAPELSESFSSLILHRTSNALQRFNIFRHVKENKPWSKVELLATMMKYSPMKSDVVIVDQGQQFDNLYLISSGTVNCLQDGNVVDSIPAGSYLGGSALVNQGLSVFQFKTATNCLFLVLPGDRFDQFLRIAPECLPILKDNLYSKKPKAIEEAPKSVGAAPSVEPTKALIGDIRRKASVWGSATVNDRVGLLKKIPLFDDLSESVLCFVNRVSSVIRIMTFPEQHNLWRQGHSADGMYIVIDGSVATSYTNPAGAEVPLTVFNKGDVLGVYCLTSSCDRLVSATTIRDSVFAFISKDNFFKLRRIVPSLDSNKHVVKARLQTVSDVLKALPYFSNLKIKEIGPLIQFDEQKLMALAALFQFRQYEQGAVVHQMGDPSTCIYHIVRGQVSVSTTRAATSSEAVRAVETATLSTNDWFGDLGKLCATTVTTTQPTLFLVLPLNNYPKFAEIAPGFARRVDQTVNLRSSTWLSRLAFFAGVKENKPWSKMSLLGTLFEFKEAEPGEVICREGDADREFYLVIEGRLKVTVINDNRVIELSILRENDWFGEISLIFNTTRTATITCLDRSLLCVLKYESFVRLKKIAPELTDSFTSLILYRTAGTLKKFKLFDSLRENKPWSKKELLASLLTYKSVERDVEVFREGDAGDYLYLILNGTVQVQAGALMHTTPLMVRAPQVTVGMKELGLLGPGEYFGEAALLDSNSPRNATATTVTPCLFLSISHSCFQKFLSVAPEILAPIQELVHQRKLRRISVVQSQAERAIPVQSIAGDPVQPELPSIAEPTEPAHSAPDSDDVLATAPEEAVPDKVVDVADAQKAPRSPRIAPKTTDPHVVKIDLTRPKLRSPRPSANADQ
ncbi:hypothetical protein PBRA_005449 [Plasmodiophora brassicae]|uniref:Cyclic nucleotide-binding domain-containing protein n=1 Tax=Plasmodiophora brassicae TaxID=37360 RepID=A0A0G4INV1_PLABS|nr:hypothetical protein PBRA_005449 [Plasmodiophora brassicae]